jgi:hypothetical protein
MLEKKKKYRTRAISGNYIISNNFKFYFYGFTFCYTCRIDCYSNFNHFFIQNIYRLALGFKIFRLHSLCSCRNNSYYTFWNDIALDCPFSFIILYSFFDIEKRPILDFYFIAVEPRNP